MTNWHVAQDRRRMRAVPNGPGGHSWVGTVPVHRLAPVPPIGASVVYVLYDRTGTPIYLGSTEHFELRLKVHLKNGKPVAHWMAYPCATRKVAYALEGHLLATCRPPLNVQRSVSR